MNPLFAAALEIQRVCADAGWRFCFIGGLAALRWGEPRLTADVDLTIATGFGGEEPVIAGTLDRFHSRVDDPAGFARANRVLLLRASNGIPIDVALGALPFEERATQRASTYRFADGVQLLTCSAEDFLVMKVFAERDSDLGRRGRRRGASRPDPRRGAGPRGAAVDLSPPCPGRTGRSRPGGAAAGAGGRLSVATVRLWTAGWGRRTIGVAWSLPRRCMSDPASPNGARGATVAVTTGARMAHAVLERLEREGKLDEALRYEILGGELVIRGIPQLSHEEAVNVLSHHFLSWTGQHGGKAFTGAGIEIGDRQLGPDVAFIGPDRVDELDVDGFHVSPDLVAEVTSPGTRSLDLAEKREAYANMGVPEYWVVDLAAQRVVVHRLAAGGGYDATEHATGTLSTEQAPGLEVPVAELFADA